MPEERTIIEYLGRSDYQNTWDSMKSLTHNRNVNTPDELWITEHAPVFTQGLNGKAEHLLTPGEIPVIQVDRGGQVTYHGPGQLVLYCLFDIQRLELGVRTLVTRIEMSIIELLAQYGIKATGKDDAPGVYVEEAKIAALGLRIRKGCCYHGLSLNIDMDLSPFERINPCGYEGLVVTQMADFGVKPGLEHTGRELAGILIRNMNCE
ncbi:MAG: lipoyl(octanoyl) transferase LipB [Proteobacteria bacterium]|nr:lipoyl(octanoyl) transferase LipB [Pseudomonadota bacterium]